ncbi:MAG: hypothetical protein GY845_31575 [Planctomycetes bacterium]|nr:hypothetical protein [Planctomycetota bacterium]
MDSKTNKPNLFPAWLNEHRNCVGMLILLFLMLGVAAYRWMELSGNAAPPGSDGGQWLAFAHQLFGGEQVRAGFQSYPPIFPFLVKTLSLDSGLLSLKFLGIACSVLICVPVYLLLRTAVSPLIASIVAILAVLTPYNYEVLCFGGYPQLLGTFFLIFSVFFLIKGMDTGAKKWFIVSALSAVATAGSNVLPTMILLMASGIAILVMSYKLWHENKPAFFCRIRLVLAWWALPACIMSLAFFTTYYNYLTSSVSVDSRDLSYMEMLRWLSESWQWEIVLWFGIINFAAVAFILNPKLLGGRNSLLSTGAASVLFAGIAGFLIFRELRCLAFVEIGLILLLGIVLVPMGSLFWRQPAKHVFALASLALVVFVVSIIGVIGDRRFEIATGWYAVVDDSVLPAMEWLDENRIDDAKVVATETEGGHNYGWWIEGYTHMPTYAATDLAWFIDEEEHAQVKMAHLLLSEDISPEEIDSLAESEDIRFLFLDKRVIQSSLDNLIAAGFEFRFETDTITVMELGGETGSSGSKTEGIHE